MSDFSGDESRLLDRELVVYGLMPAFSRAFSVKAAAAAATVDEVFGRVAGLDVVGFNGRGGGALSGSELSHLIV